MKKFNLLLVALLIVAFAVFALGSGESNSNDQGSDAVSNDQIGDYSLVIDSCRIAKGLEGQPVVIVKYIFSNVNDDDAVSYNVAFDDAVYQNGVGLNEAWFVDDSAEYDMDNQSKEIKKGATIEVEVAYELNDTTSDIEVEVSQLFSFDDTTITKTLSLGEGAGSSEDGTEPSDETPTAQETGTTVATQPAETGDRLGDYSLVIDSCRMAKDYEGKPVAIVKYIFGNVSDDNAAAFSFALDATAYQNGVGLNEAYFLDDSADYSMDNLSKEIKKGASIEVEVAYELNDTTTDIEVEVAELFSFDDTTITKTFTIA